MALRDLPVRSKLALIFVGVCLLTFVVGGYFVSGTAKGVLEEEIRARLDYQSQVFAVALDGALQTLAQRTVDFASDGVIRDRVEELRSEARPAEADRIRTDLREHLLVNKLPLVGAFMDLALVSKEGGLLLAARGTPLPQELARLEDQAIGEGPWFSGLIEPTRTGGPPRLAIVTPLTSRRGGAPLGTLVAWVHPGVWIVDALRAGDMSVEAPLGEVGLRIVDRSGTRLVVGNELSQPSGPASDSELVLSGFGLELVKGGGAPSSSTGPGASPAGFITKSYPISGNGYRNGSGNGWFVEIEVREPDVLAPVAGLESRFLGLGIVLSLAACALFLFPMRVLTRPIVDLATAARRLKDGEFSTRVSAESADEIGELGRSFNAMAAAIEERTHRLEEQADGLRDRQRELAHERDRLKTVISSMRDPLIVLDADGEVAVHNRAARPLLRELEADLSTLAPHHLCGEQDGSESRCRTCLFSPSAGPRSCVVEVDGGVYEIHAARLGADANGRSGRLIVGHDLTDRIAQDERQIHQERLAVLGEVAAVMAHELNNPLAAISMYNQMLATEVAENAELAESVHVIQRNVESCKQTIRELLDYSTNAVPAVGPVDVNATLEDVAAFLRPLRERSGVELELELSDEPLEVAGDEVQIRQIFVNLVVNAIQAIGSAGGRVSISTEVEEGYLHVSVEDSGEGIPRDVSEQIFRPFFTTKGRGEGTGLGLPTARRIAEMHGGGLELVRSDETGTVFQVRLRILSAPGHDGGGEPAPRDILNGTEVMS